MPLSPRLYDWLVRPRWLTKKYIHNHINSQFHLENQYVLDVGSGTGANCNLCDPSHYIGIEPDAGRVRLAKRLYPHHNFIIVDVDEQRIPLQKNSIDCVFVIAVLHHLSDEKIRNYLLEFDRVLKPSGKIIAMEPYLCSRSKFNNWFMNRYDHGDYIRNEYGYLKLFEDGEYECNILNKFRKCFVYNEIFFVAARKAARPVR